MGSRKFPLKKSWMMGYLPLETQLVAMRSSLAMVEKFGEVLGRSCVGKKGFRKKCVGEESWDLIHSKIPVFS